MLLDDIVSLLREISRNAYVTDNERVDDRIWEEFIMIKRNMYIKNYINEKGTYEQNNLQFEVLDVEKYDSALDLGGESLGKYILRTTPCPNLIEGRSGVAVYELSVPDIMSKTVGYVSMDRLRWCGNGKTNKNAIFAAYYDGPFYIKAASQEAYKGIKKLRVGGIFADPRLVSTYNRDVDDYPINDYQVEYIKNAILTQDLNFLLQSKSDETNDSSGNIEGQRPIQTQAPQGR